MHLDTVCPVNIEPLHRPGDTDSDHEDRLRTATFSWLLREVVPSGRTLADLGAGPCVFARYATQAGYRVTAVDGRTDRLPDELPSAIEFVQSDVRDFALTGFDVVAMLGLLYHLTLDEQLALLRRAAGSTVIVDTQLHDPDDPAVESLDWARQTVHTDEGYSGVLFPDGATPVSSLRQQQSFWHTEPSLLQLFGAAGFSTVSPIEPAYASKYGPRKFYVAI